MSSPALCLHEQRVEPGQGPDGAAGRGARRVLPGHPEASVARTRTTESYSTHVMRCSMPRCCLMIADDLNRQPRKTALKRMLM